MIDKLHTGELYLPGDDDVMAEQQKCLELLYDYNMTRPSESEKREKMLREMFAEIGERCYIEPPLRALFFSCEMRFFSKKLLHFTAKYDMILKLSFDAAPTAI